MSIKKIGTLLGLSITILSGCTLPGMSIMEEGSPLWEQSGVDGALPILEPVLVNITPDYIFLEQRLSTEEARVVARSQPREQPPFDYKIGPQDVLKVIVYGHSDLTNPTGQTRGQDDTDGQLVRSDGTIFYPYVGVLEVAGKTAEEVRKLLTKRLAKYLEKPQVDVRIASYRSQYIYVTGEIENPCVLPITDRPLPLVEAITRCGGVKDTADPRSVQLTRNGETISLDLLRLYAENAELWTLYPGDKLYIPNNRQNQVFVLGYVNNQRALTMPEGKLTLAEAITSVEGMHLGSANPGGIYVIRGLPVKDERAPGIQRLQPVMYQLDASSVDALILADQFNLKPRDIVYVSAAGAVKWNSALAQVLPTLQLLFQSAVIADRVNN